MKAFSIVMRGNDYSEFGYERLVKSSFKVGNTFPINRFDAVVPPVEQTMKDLGVEWNYPWVGFVSDFATGLVKRAYETAQPQSRIACALSHYSLWNFCITLDEPILILEHDAVWITKLTLDVDKHNFDIIGINNPLGATRRAQQFYQAIVEDPKPVQLTPKIDGDTIPQGLAGNSAYIIKPSGAEHMVKLVKEYGLWPNDAIMCRQLVPRLGVTRKFYTHVGTMRSTTTL